VGKFINLIGEQYGKLTVLSQLPNKGKHTIWSCKCSCGNVAAVASTHLRSGHTQSCGCHREEVRVSSNTTHGVSDSPIYPIWLLILRRCYSEKDRLYARYGGRGIKVWDKWLDNPAEFVSWCQNNGWVKGLDIDREDNNGDYTPDNCRFVTRLVNNHNREYGSKTRNSKTGIAGVSPSGTGFRAYIGSRVFSGAPEGAPGRQINLGVFSTVEAALKSRNNFITEHSLPNRIQEVI